MPNQKKIDTVTSLTEKFNKAPGVVFLDYSETSANELASLRSQLKELDGEFVIAKNTLTTRAAGEMIPQDKYPITGQTALIFAFSNPLSVIKSYLKVHKETKKMAPKLALIEGRTLLESEVLKLSNVAEREVLLSRMLGSVTSPLRRLAYAANSPIRGVVIALHQVAEGSRS